MEYFNKDYYKGKIMSTAKELQQGKFDEFISPDEGLFERNMDKKRQYFVSKYGSSIYI